MLGDSLDFVAFGGFWRCLSDDAERDLDFVSASTEQRLCELVPLFLVQHAIAHFCVRVADPLERAAVNAFCESRRSE